MKLNYFQETKPRDEIFRELADRYNENLSPKEIKYLGTQLRELAPFLTGEDSIRNSKLISALNLQIFHKIIDELRDSKKTGSKISLEEIMPKYFNYSNL